MQYQLAQKLALIHKDRLCIPCINFSVVTKQFCVDLCLIKDSQVAVGFQEAHLWEENHW